MPGTGLHVGEEGVAAGTSGIRAGPARDLAADDTAAQVVLAFVVVGRDVGAVEHGEQLVAVGEGAPDPLVGQPVAGASPEGAREAALDDGAAPSARPAATGTKQPVRPPDAAAHLIDGLPAGVALDRQRAVEPFGMDPARELMRAEVELAGVVARDGAVPARQAVREQTAEAGALGGDEAGPWGRRPRARRGTATTAPARRNDRLDALSTRQAPDAACRGSPCTGRFIARHVVIEGAAHEVEEGKPALRARRSFSRAGRESGSWTASRAGAAARLANAASRASRYRSWSPPIAPAQPSATACRR